MKVEEGVSVTSLKNHQTLDVDVVPEVVVTV